MTIWRLTCLLALAGLGACASDQAVQPADIRPLHYSSGSGTLKRVDGLRAALAASPQQPVRVLALHGMISHEANFSRPMQDALAQRLGLRRVAASPGAAQPNLPRGYTVTPAFGAQPFDAVAGPLPLSQLRRTAWVDAAAPPGAPERLVFYELLWAPLRDRIKHRFIGCFESAALRRQADCQAFSKSLPNPDSRSLLNRLLGNRTSRDSECGALPTEATGNRWRPVAARDQPSSKAEAVGSFRTWHANTRRRSPHAEDGPRAPRAKPCPTPQPRPCAIQVWTAPDGTPTALAGGEATAAGAGRQCTAG